MATLTETDIRFRYDEAKQWMQTRGEDRTAEEMRADLSLAAEKAKEVEAFNRQADDLTNEHVEACAGLQAELANPETTAQRKVELRGEVNNRNNELEAKLKGIRAEIDIARLYAAGKTIIENAWAKRLSTADRERDRALEAAAIQLEQRLLFPIGKAAREKNDHISAERERVKRTGRERYSDLEELETVARRYDAVVSIFHKLAQEIQAERDEIRQRQMAKLYEST